MGDGPCAKPPSWLVFGKACLHCIESSYKMRQIPGRLSNCGTVPRREGTRVMSLLCICKSLRKTSLRGDINIHKRILILLLTCTTARSRNRSERQEKQHKKSRRPRTVSLLFATSCGASSACIRRRCRCFALSTTNSANRNNAGEICTDKNHSWP